MTKPKPEPQVAEFVDLPDDDELQTAADIARYIRHTPVGLEYDDQIPFEAWERTFKFYSAIGERTNWWIGDCLRAGEKFGDRYNQAVHIFGLSRSRLTTFVSVAGKFADIKRRREQLSYRHHEAVAYAPYQTADELLTRAIKENLSSDDLRKEVARLEEIRSGKPAKPKGKRGSKLPRAANVNEVKEIIDIAPATKTGLFWNGYRLETKDRNVFQGPETLSEEEAEKAAHYFGFAHWPALVNWLGQNGFTNPQELPKFTPSEETKVVTLVPPSAKADSNPAPIPVDPPPWGHALWHHISVEHGQNLLESELNEIIHLAEPLIDARRAAVSPQSPVAAPKAESPLEIAERHLRAFNEASKGVDWAQIKGLARKKWYSLLAVPDKVIDTIQEAEIKEAKAK